MLIATNNDLRVSKYLRRLAGGNELISGCQSWKPKSKLLLAHKGLLASNADDRFRRLIAFLLAGLRFVCILSVPLSFLSCFCTL